MERKRKSIALSKEEHKAFNKLYASFPTKVDAEDSFEVKRQILDMVVLRGSASSKTIEAIRRRLEEVSIGQRA